MVDIYVTNTAPSLTDTIRIDGEAFDLTNSSVKLQMKKIGESAFTVDAAATIVSAEDGTVRYDWDAADVDTVGAYIAWWHITLPSTDTQDTDDFRVNIIQHGYSANLCTVNDIRLQSEWLSSDTSVDGKVDELISQASAQIMQYVNREFAPATNGLTRRFRIRRNYRADLAPYDLRTATEITINPDGSNPKVLTEDEYELRPFVSRHGVYGWLHLSPLVTLSDPRIMRFGHAYVDIEGDWGFSQVPDDVRRATIITVTSWLRRGDPQLMGTEASQRLGYNNGNLQPSPQGTYSLPYSAQDVLKPYRRFTGHV